MRRRGAFWIVALVAVVAVLLLIGSGSRSNRGYLDPNGVGNDGLKGVLELARSYGATVDLLYGLPEPRHTVALLATDSYDSAESASLTAWVRSGGTLVLASPQSDLLPRRSAVRSSGEEIPAGACTVRALSNVRSISIPPGSQPFRVSATSQSCFSVGETDAYVVVRSEGRGNIVAITDPRVFTNGRLDLAGNAVLAASLLAPSRSSSVAFLRAPAIGSGDESVVDLIPAGVSLGVVQLAAGFLVFAWFSARRLGRPLIEDPPVQIESSELVAAVGRLLARSGTPQHAAAVLRADARRALALDLSLAPSTPVEGLIAVITSCRGCDSASLASLLYDHPVHTEADLVNLATALDSLRQEIRNDARV